MHPNVCTHRCAFLLVPFMDLFETPFFVVLAASKHVMAFPPKDNVLFFHILFIDRFNQHSKCILL